LPCLRQVNLQGRWYKRRGAAPPCPDGLIDLVMPTGVVVRMDAGAPGYSRPPFALAPTRFLVHHLPVQIDPETLPDDPDVLQHMPRAMLRQLHALLPWIWKQSLSATSPLSTTALAA
jgi:hypothetical protein